MGNRTRNFSDSEFLCPCGCQYYAVEWLLIESMQSLRDRCNSGEWKLPSIQERWMRVVSAKRCRPYNVIVRGRRPGLRYKDIGTHVEGTGVDPIVKGMTALEVAREAMYIKSFRDGGVGIYANANGVDSLHLDVRTDGPAIWGRKRAVEELTLLRLDIIKVMR